MSKLVCVLFAAALSTATAIAQSLVVPAGLRDVDGNATNAFPWGRGGTGLLHQSVYDASHFLTQGVSYPVLITGARWRSDNGSALYASSYTGGCTIKLSTCPLNYAAVSTTLASNRGADETNCYSGVVSWAAQPAQPAPAPFGISVPFTTPFLYDPNAGDLNVECDLPIQTFTGSLPGMDVQTAAPLASRIFVSTGYPGTGTGVITQNHGVVVELTYVPAAPLYAAFTANVTGGPSPLAVGFTSTSASTAAGGITSWAWDFNGDNVVDSTQPNPTWVYAACGDYTVSLTVTDGVNAPVTSRFVNYIRTDRIVADFTAAVVGAQTVQFTDACNMPATSYAWDFNGDNVVDSTQPNPVWTFPNALPTSVKLTATRLCTAPSTKVRTIDVVQALATNYVGNVGAGALWTVYFDAAIANPAGVEVRALAINASAVATVGTPFSLDVYVKAGSYTGGFHTQPAAWRQVGVASGVSAANGTPSVAALAAPFYLPSGSYGVALRYNGLGPIYNYNGGPNVTYGNGDLTLTLGASQNSSTAPFTGTLNTSRSWNGTIYYETNNVAGGAAYGFFDAGCSGTLGAVTIPATSSPTLGGTLNVNVNNLPVGIGVMILGLSRPPALDLGFLGAPGCPLRVSLDATTTLFGAGTSATWSFAIPASPALSGFRLFNQAASLDPALNAFGFALSDAAGWILGN